MARSRWYLIKIEKGKLHFISEIPDTSPELTGSVDEDGNITTRGKDIHGYETVYRSEDQGRTWLRQ